MILADLDVLVTAFGSGSREAGSTTWLRAQAFADELSRDGIRLHVSGTVPPWIYPWGWYGGGAAKLRRIFGLATGLVKRLAQWVILPYRYDVHVALRDVYCFTFPPVFERLFAKRAPFFIFEIDDAIWEEPIGGPPAFWTPNRAICAAKLADRMIVGNEYLADWARQYCDDVRVIPTVPAKNICPSVALRAEGPCRVLWYGNMSYIPWLAEIFPALSEAAARCQLDLRLITHPNALRQYNFPSDVNLRLVAWDPRTEGEEMAHCDVGLMPMPDDRWSRGKCASKLIHYMAAGLATIASPYGMNREVVVDGETGFLVETQQEWEDALVTLASDPDLCARMGAAGRRRYEEHYSQAVAIPLYRNAVTPPPGVCRRKVLRRFRSPMASGGC